jgi:hypothetical protein
LLVTAAGIWYVFHDPQKRAQIADALREADRNWVIPRRGEFLAAQADGIM